MCGNCSPSCIIQVEGMNVHLEVMIRNCYALANFLFACFSYKTKNAIVSSSSLNLKYYPEII